MPNSIFLFCHALETTREQIEHGVKAYKNQFPYVVQVHNSKPNITDFFKKKFEHQGSRVCTGVIIAPKFVLTAAHCVGNFVKNANDGMKKMWAASTENFRLEDEMWVVAGNIHLDNAWFQYTVTKVDDIIPHRRYYENDDDDSGYENDDSENDMMTEPDSCHDIALL